MKKTFEVLAPVRDIDGIIPMAQAGADAVYAGLSGLSSRPSEVDFSLEDILKSVPVCRSQGVKLYVAVNVNISEQKRNETIRMIEKMDAAGVDAVILADYGLIHELKKKQTVKHAAIHASTLLGAYNIHTARLLKDWGVSRIIFYANLYFDEMAAIINAVPEMEYELVAEGGTCFNDIRQCLLPHTFINGDHRLFCREKYDIERSDGARTAAKPICEYENKVADVLGIYMGLGITSFKVEGRTAPLEDRIPIVKEVRKAVDYYSEKESLRAYLHYFSRANRGVW